MEQHLTYGLDHGQTIRIHGYGPVEVVRISESEVLLRSPMLYNGGWSCDRVAKAPDVYLPEQARRDA
jgi:hypothetical protein